MATQQSNIDFITDQIQTAGNIRSRKMFGEYAIYCDEKVVALVCDDMLFVKITEAGRALLNDPTEAPAYPGAKQSFQIDEALLENSEALAELIRVTADELPLPKPKKPRKLH